MGLWRSGRSARHPARSIASYEVIDLLRGAIVASAPTGRVANTP
jgi:hypothetical protein